MKEKTKAIRTQVSTCNAVNTFISDAQLDGIACLRITKDPVIQDVDEATYAKFSGLDFVDGTIEVKMLSRLLPDAPAYARGFIGIAFRINEDDSLFECFYVRPTNGSCDDQVRKNHTTQYFSYPDHKFDRLRNDFPKKYESFADIDVGEWIDVRIEVSGMRAELYINGSKRPVLVVLEMFHGLDTSGAVGLWVDVGTEGFFRDLRITHRT